MPALLHLLQVVVRCKPLPDDLSVTLPVSRVTLDGIANNSKTARGYSHTNNTQAKLSSMDRAMLALAFSLAFFLLQGAESTPFSFKNNCPYTVWPATLGGSPSPQLSQTGFELPSGAAPVSVDAPAGWSGRFWARTGCATDSSGKFSCQTGDCGSGQVSCNGAGGKPPATLIEVTVKGDGGKDFYDISLVDGFNVPVSVVPQGGPSCPSTACAANINADCPSQLAVKGPDGSVVGCNSACDFFNTDQYCCRGAFASVETCKPSTYSQMFKAQCPQAYTYAHDDQTSTFTCLGAASYDVTFCPN